MQLKLMQQKDIILLLKEASVKSAMLHKICALRLEPKMPCITKFCESFIFADGRFFVFCRNKLWQLRNTGFSRWGLRF